MDYQRDDGRPMAKGDGTYQAVRRLLVTSPGQWLASPLAGMGAFDLLMGPVDPATTARLRSKIRQGLEAEGIAHTTITIPKDLKITIEI